MIRLPACTVTEIDEELTDIGRDLRRAENAVAVSPDAELRRQEKLAGLREWKHDLLFQRESMTTDSVIS